MEGGHLPHVHAVDVVGGEHRDGVRRVRLQELQVLVHRVGSAFVLSAQSVRARQQYLDGAARPGEPGCPRRLDVRDQRRRLVLGEHVDGGDPRVDQIAQDEVDDAKAVGELERRLGVLGSERIEAGAFATGQH